MVDDYMLDKALNKIKEKLGIEKLDDTKILIDTKKCDINEVFNK